MKLQLRCGLAVLFVACQTTLVSAALMDITRPGDTIQLVSGVNQGDGDAGPPPANEGVENAINDTAAKYLNFLDLNSGFSVSPSITSEPVVGLRLYTANDAPERDPASYQLLGSNDSIDGPWEVVSSGNLSLPADRNENGDEVIPPSGNLGAFHQEVSFDNALTYDHYQVIFPTLKDAAAANSMQIGEVELLAVPEPASLTLALFALLGLARIVRR